MIDEILEYLDKICGDHFTEEWKNLNFLRIPTTAINATPGSETDFNYLYQMLLKSDFEPIKRTKSGGISISKENRLYHHYKYDVKIYKSVIEITVCLPVNNKMRSYRIQYRTNNYKDSNNEEQLISGRESFNIFKKELKKDGIDLNDYSVSTQEGIKLNSEITSPDIRLINPLNVHRTFEQACHLDFHKFYISGLYLSYPEFRPAIQRLADKAKDDKKYKTILASVIGFMHSPVCGYKFTNLAKQAINTAYERYYQVFYKLAQERTILATNTDGIWYSGEAWNGDFEGSELGEWNNDHINTKLRFKSAGSYEFIEDGKYFPVVRGRTRLDLVKDRTLWSWGDIFSFDTKIEIFKFKKGVGIIWEYLKA